MSMEKPVRQVNPQFLAAGNARGYTIRPGTEQEAVMRTKALAKTREKSERSTLSAADWPALRGKGHLGAQLLTR